MVVTLNNAQESTDLLTRTTSDNQPDPTNFSRALKKYFDKPATFILQISTVFPFDLFPDIITIEETKVKVVINYSSFSSRVHGILIRDITDVVVDTHLFLATLTMVDSSNYQFPIEIKVNNLQIEDALRARSIIQDLVAVQRQRMNIQTNPYRG